ncbi:hypothetical protein AWZ03_001698 [Drosophila navojoa]|uniref:Uncharacterized protein n=1 Tax=Drosophila navojoa TaxID=7232 RepID=A0A484BTB5_DRONA|nr:hypothetical protein AWZ03_001698 [Drosophila navojoa]
MTICRVRHEHESSMEANGNQGVHHGEGGGWVERAAANNSDHINGNGNTSGNNKCNSNKKSANSDSSDNSDSCY